MGPERVVPGSKRRERVAVVDCTDADAGRFSALAGRFELEVFRGIPSEEDLIERGRGAGAIITLFTYTKFTDEVFGSLPGLRLVATRTAGYSHIDVEAAARHGVAVANVPDAPVPSVAEYVFAMILSFERRVAEAAADVKAGNWSFTSFLGGELRGTTLGIIGLGNIGACVARVAAGFGMRVIASSRTHRPMLAYSLGVEYVPLERLLASSDYICVTASLTPETERLLDEERLSLVKPGALLINTARGGIIDEAALYRLLEGGKIRGACLDVLADEPPKKGNPLFELPNVVVTPHIAWHTRETLDRQFEGAVGNVVDFFEGGGRNGRNGRNIVNLR